jgi:hypothetical protein
MEGVSKVKSNELKLRRGLGGGKENQNSNWGFGGHGGTAALADDFLTFYLVHSIYFIFPFLKE